MSPARFAAHSKAWRVKERRKAERSAMIACILANSNREKNTPAFKLDDFLPEWLREDEDDDE